MTKKFLPALLVIAALCMAPSCSDDEDDVINNPTENTGDENTGDENTGDENTGDEGTSDGENPLVDGKIVLDGEAFTGYSNGKIFPDDVSLFEDEEFTEVNVLPTALLGSHTGHAYAYVRSDWIDYWRTDTPTTITITENTDGYEFHAESYRWDMDLNSYHFGTDPYEVKACGIYTNADQSVYYLNSGATETHYLETRMTNWGQSGVNGNFGDYEAHEPSENGGLWGYWRVYQFDGKISADGSKYDFFVYFFNIAGGVNMTFVSGDATPAECMASHYHGTLDFENEWLSGTTSVQGDYANYYDDPGEMYALLKPDPYDGSLLIDIMGFDIEGNQFGNLTISGITDINDHGNWVYDFVLDDFEVEMPINGVMGTVTGSLEGEMSASGHLLIVIDAVFPAIGKTAITFEGDYNDWVVWNGYYGGNSNRPW